MKLRELKQDFQTQLHSIYAPQEAESLFFIFLEERLGMSRLSYLSHSEAIFNESSWPTFRLDLHGLKEGKPYQHVLGSVNFAGLRIAVNSDALVPRPETEEMFIRLQRQLNEAVKSAVDVGTGTGALALALKQYYPSTAVEAWDVSDAALTLAAQNAAEYSLDIAFRKLDFLDEQQWPDKEFELLLSNPPYIAESESADMEPVVLDHDPHLALFAPGADPLIFYRKLALFAHRHLASKGRVLLECNRAFTQEVARLFEDFDMATEVWQDAYEAPRFVWAMKS